MLERREAGPILAVGHPSLGGQNPGAGQAKPAFLAPVGLQHHGRGDPGRDIQRLSDRASSDQLGLASDVSPVRRQETIDRRLSAASGG